MTSPVRPTRPARALLAALVLAAGSLTALATSGAAHADTRLCGAYDKATIQGRYVVQNNRWGTSETQCIDVTDTGFRIAQADGSASTSGPPKSYPSVFDGCHYTVCAPGTSLPRQISAIGSAPSSISFTYVDDAVFDAAYDIWLDPEPKTDGVNQTEIMIWLHHLGPVQPVGERTGSADLGGRTWDVWTGNNGGNDVVSYVATSATSHYDFDVRDFVRDVISLGKAADSWYLTSVQAGFEPWENGTGLAVNSFFFAVN